MIYAGLIILYLFFHINPFKLVYDYFNMIKEREVAMVQAAALALEYKSKHPRAWDDDAVAHAFKNLDTTSELKLYGVAAANEALKIRSAYKDLTEKQVMQTFSDNIAKIVAKIEKDIKEK